MNFKKDFFDSLFNRRKKAHCKDCQDRTEKNTAINGSPNNNSTLLNKTLDVLARLETSGYILDAEKAKLISPITACRPVDMDCDTSFVCEMYPSLTDAKIEEYSKDFVFDFPVELKELYKHTNGIRLYDRYINVTGLCSPFVSMNSSEGKAPTPIRYLDNSSNAARAKKFRGDGKLFFAWYQTEPQMVVYMDCSATSPIKPVYACYKGSEDVLASWPSFDDWFSSEYDKFAHKYDNGEYKINDFANGLTKSLEFL